MPDNLHPTIASVPAPFMPATNAEPNGWLVIARRVANVVPPYRYAYMHQHYADQSDAVAFHREIASGEYGNGWIALGIQSCRHGVPCGPMVPL